MTTYLWPLGDSLTAPYVGTLAARLAKAKLDVLLVGTQTTGAQHHEGHGGYRLQRVADAVPSYLASLATQGIHPDAAIVVLGTNDLISMPFPNIPNLIAQWNALIDQLQAAGVKTIVAGTTPQTTIATSSGIPLFNAALRVAAAKRHIPLVDLERKLDPKKLRDGAHFNAEGAADMGNAIADVVVPVLSQRQGASAGGGGGAVVVAALAVLAGALLLRK